MIKTKVMADALNKEPKYRGFFDCMITTLKTEKPSYLFRGLSITLLRSFPVAATSLTMNDLILRALVENK